MQRGYIFKSNGAWFLRYYEKFVVDGQSVSKQRAARLAPINDDYRSKKDLQPLIERILEPLNRGSLPEGGLTFADFFEHHFLPHVKERRKPSTVKFYRDAFNNHLKHTVGDIRLRDFTTAHAQSVLDRIKLSHQSLLRIKTAMSAAFTIARQKDFIRSANPITGTKAEGKRTKFKPHAYSLDEVAAMLAKLPEPARTVVAVAAFTGLRHGEIRGLRWEDYDGESLQVERSIWRTHVGDTKTSDSAGRVPVIPFLQKILTAHGVRVGRKGYIFAGEKKRFALTLDNLAGRVIRPTLGDAWKGWHAFRRGQATNLYELGVQPKTIQAILRHARVETTQHHYVILEQTKAGDAAMRKLERAVAKHAANMQRRSS
ncbi:MAG: tyrosine-type recombinase/integrase [Candidatus Acidiferrum sp.]